MGRVFWSWELDVSLEIEIIRIMIIFNVERKGVVLTIHKWLADRLKIHAGFI